MNATNVPRPAVRLRENQTTAAVLTPHLWKEYPSISLNAHAHANLNANVNVKDEAGPQRSTLALNGKQWQLQTFTEHGSHLTHLPDYICVSYIWGSGREPNPFLDEPKVISINTIPALSAAMSNTDCKAYWIDAFCIPSKKEDIARRATLESMGYIYSKAEEVRAALSARSFTAVQDLSRNDRIDDSSLDILNKDEWVKMQVVNSRSISFVCPKAPGVVVSGSHFLNDLGFSLTKYKQQRGLSTFDIRQYFPSLDALEDLIANWQIADFAERSALQVMSNMDRREWRQGEDKNYFYSMIGAVTKDPCKRPIEKETRSDLAELFMDVCKRKNGVSFIYSSAPRADVTGQRWRPRSGLLPSIVPWHSWGDAQPGTFDEHVSLWLERVLSLQESSSPLSAGARQFIAEWLPQEQLGDANDDEIVSWSHATLVRMGFKENEVAMNVGDGLFFPHSTPPPGSTVTVIVSTTIRWVFGALGIVRIVAENTIPRYIPGVFVGDIGKETGSSCCLD
ncbi:hypothetical protein H2202_006484 [Exophiala xenobiotica]|nr:hypothetical protein H2202_006484 [Exophiala xenobiotica]